MSKGNPEGLPIGLDDSEETTKDPLISKMKSYLVDQYNGTTRILAENKNLLLETAKYLVKNRCMFADDFKEFVKKYGKNMPETGTISETYWIDMLKK